MIPALTPAASNTEDNTAIVVDDQAIQRKNRKYTNAFKAKVARRIVYNGEMVTYVARELGINDSVISRWVKEFRALRGKPENKKVQDAKSVNLESSSQNNLFDDIREFDKINNVISVSAKPKNVKTNTDQQIIHVVEAAVEELKKSIQMLKNSENEKMKILSRLEKETRRNEKIIHATIGSAVVFLIVMALFGTH